MNLYIDFGGTHFRYQLDNGAIETQNSNTIDLKNFLDAIIEKYPKISAIYISFAGVVYNGKILSSPNTNTTDFDVATYIKKKYSIDLLIDNDLNCAALAEKNSLGTDSLGVFYIGTGFGSAFIDNGKLIKGAHNTAGEIGHIPFKKAPFICGCGRDDCLELYVSGAAVIKWSDYFNIDAKFQRIDLLEKLDDQKAKIIVENFYLALAYGFHTALNLFDFDRLVLGGSVGKQQKIKDFLTEQLSKTAFGKKNLPISLSTLENGSLEGAKLLNSKI